MPPSMSPFCYGGGKLNLVKQMEVTLSRAGYTTAMAQIQSGAPVDLLLGTDQLPHLGFRMTAYNADGSIQDLLQKPPLSQNDQNKTVPSSVPEHTTCPPSTSCQATGASPKDGACQGIYPTSNQCSSAI